MAPEDLLHWELGVAATALGIALVAGLSLRPTLANLVARLQIAATNPFRVGDQLMTETECGSVEKITSTYVVLKLIDKRRMIIPMSYILRHPFQNLTRQNIQFVGELKFETERLGSISCVRAHLRRVLHNSDRWDCRVAELQVVSASPARAELRCTFSAANARDLALLRFEVREKLFVYLQSHARPRKQFDFTALSAAIPGLQPQGVKGRDR